MKFDPTFGCVYELIEVWSDDTIQDQLEGSHRNQQVYKKISKILAEKGYTRMCDQCRQKVKKLRKDYKRLTTTVKQDVSAKHGCHFGIQTSH